MYRKRQKISKKLELMRLARERKRINSGTYDYPVILPDLRRIVIIIDFDFGKAVNIIRLYKTERVDCYKAVVEGKIWKEKIGWTKVLEGVRKSFIRVGSVNTI